MISLIKGCIFCVKSINEKSQVLESFIDNSLNSIIPNITDSSFSDLSKIIDFSKVEQEGESILDTIDSIREKTPLITSDNKLIGKNEITGILDEIIDIIEDGLINEKQNDNEANGKDTTEILLQTVFNDKVKPLLINTDDIDYSPVETKEPAKENFE
jgi:hypothetical protein